MMFGVTYLLARDWHCADGQYSTRKAVWQVHQTVDKCIKLGSTDLRKVYHRQVHKANKKLMKYKLIELKPSKPSHFQVSYPGLDPFLYC